MIPQAESVDNSHRTTPIQHKRQPKQLTSSFKPEAEPQKPSTPHKRYSTFLEEFLHNESIVEQSFHGGTLLVKVFEAQLEHNTELIGQMDPFIKLSHNGHSVSSKVISGGGKNPQWHETLSVPVESLDGELIINCYDKDLLGRELIGQRQLEISKCVKPEHFKKWLQLLFEGKQAGLILLGFKFIANNGVLDNDAQSHRSLNHAGSATSISIKLFNKQSRGGLSTPQGSDFSGS